jgi:hypothetical protein
MATNLTSDRLEVRASEKLPGQVEFAAEADGIQPTLVADLGKEPTVVTLPFTPMRAGQIRVKIVGRWGVSEVPDPVEVSLDVKPAATIQADSLGSKLGKLFEME